MSNRINDTALMAVNATSAAEEEDNTMITARTRNSGLAQEATRGEMKEVGYMRVGGVPFSDVYVHPDSSYIVDALLSLLPGVITRTRKFTDKVGCRQKFGGVIVHSGDFA